MNKIISILIGVSILMGCCAASVLAQTSTNATSTDVSLISELLQTLKQKIEELKTQIEELTRKIAVLRQERAEIKQITKEIKQTLQLTRQLQWGMSGEDVKLLQEILATDPEIYPKKLVTGYFGPLTHQAVKRFQKKANLEQVGRVGPKTLARINELLTEGAGSSGKVPPGLLVAPGIRKKIGGITFQPLPGQVLPPGIAKKIETVTPTENGINSIIW